MLGRAHKYRAIAVEVDGHKFPSKAEARRYGELKLLERAGEIRQLELHPRYRLIVNGIDCGYYEADAKYYQGDTLVVEDTKGVRTETYNLKKKLVFAIYGINVTEIGRKSPAKPPRAFRRMGRMARLSTACFML